MQSKRVKRRLKNKLSTNLLYSKLNHPVRFLGGQRFLWGHSGPQHGGHGEEAEQDQHDCG